jgi:hypothetical protein
MLLKKPRIEKREWKFFLEAFGVKEKETARRFKDNTK